MPNLASWTREEEKAFENAIAVHSISEPDEESCDKIAYVVPSKSIEEIKLHFEALVEDVGAIEAGKIALPNYGNEESLSTSFTKEQRANSNQGNGNSGFVHSSVGSGNKGSSKLDQERKKGIPWTEEEHRLFLLGLDKFGKGDWRSISRNFVITRTPTQVASHAQKYFIRLNSMNRDRRRSSIHDITTVNGGNVPANQTTVTGHQNSNTTIAAVGGVLANKNRITQHNVGPGLGMYGTHIGHPVSSAPSAVGTPVMGHRHPLYAVPNAYPMAPPPMHR